MTQRITDEDVERIAERLHDEYESAASKNGWATQERSRVAWADVPEANKQTMRDAIRNTVDGLGLTFMAKYLP